MKKENLYKTPFAKVYPYYVKKVENKGRSITELHQIIEWLTGFNEEQLQKHLSQQTNFEDFYNQANINANAHKIKGVVCGIKVEEIDDPLMQKLRYLDKLIDELAKGKTLDKILRT